MRRTLARGRIVTVVASLLVAGCGHATAGSASSTPSADPMLRFGPFAVGDPVSRVTTALGAGTHATATTEDVPAIVYDDPPCMLYVTTADDRITGIVVFGSRTGPYLASGELHDARRTPLRTARHPARPIAGLAWQEQTCAHPFHMLATTPPKWTKGDPAESTVGSYLPVDPRDRNHVMVRGESLALGRPPI